VAAYLTTAQVAERWACDRSTVTARARSGELVGMRLGTDWRFSHAAVEAYERAHTTSAEPAYPAPAKLAAEPIRPVFGVLEETGAPLPLPERWWEQPTQRAASSAAGRGRASKTKKAALRGN
jgi:excisionase family DNA binding protein